MIRNPALYNLTNQTGQPSSRSFINERRALSIKPKNLAKSTLRDEVEDVEQVVLRDPDEEFMTAIDNEP